jgi:D-alanyl-lipoteichoic acid acyltransferase DltB (MBOAT superfamily)
MSELYNNLLYFLGYSIIASGIFWLTPPKNRSAILLIINLLFYTLCAGWFVVFVIFAGVWSFICARRIDVYENEFFRKKWLLKGISPVLLLLCFFKYWTPTNSIIGNILSDTEGFILVKVVLPLGMSYYILKSISYMFDVYRRKIVSEQNLINYLAYISFYGQIVSGPIQRYEQWDKERRNDSWQNSFVDGYYNIILGLFMKLVIANRLSDFITVTFSSPMSANGIQLWLGFFLYSIFIYCDFAGYSYIAIGVTNFHGIDCINNFDRPYLSRNIREFWGRWHISLSSWLKDYIYIPLGGNRKGAARRVLNVMIVFLICGMWHGSTISFVVWGIFHGVANVLSKKTKRTYNSAVNNLLPTLLTFLIVSTGWIFFASATLGDALSYFKGMFTRVSFDLSSVQEAILGFASNNTCLALFLTSLFFISILLLKEANDIYKVLPRSKVTSFVWQVFLVSSVLLFGVFGANKFIYAGF